MPAIDSHLMRARLVSDLGTRLGQALIGGWLQSAAQPPSGSSSSLYQSYLREATAGSVADNIKVAESFYVTDDMMTLAEHAAQLMPDEWLQREDLPAEAGFLWLPRSITSYDVRGRMLHTRAVSWHPFHGALALTHWTDRDDLDDDINAQLEQNYRTEWKESWSSMPKLQMQHVYPDPWGGGIPHAPRTGDLYRWRQMLGVGFIPSYQGEAITWTVAEDVGTEENRIHAKRLLIMNPPDTNAVDPVASFFAAFCRLCQQSITVSEKEPTDRITRRRARNLPNAESVTVINLRHAANQRQEGETQVEWSHRWLRRGHWRRQWYGSGEEKHQAPVWIHEAVCGPEDRPLIIRDHVTSLSR